MVGADPAVVDIRASFPGRFSRWASSAARSWRSTHRIARAMNGAATMQKPADSPMVTLPAALITAGHAMPVTPAGQPESERMALRRCSAS
jgi:hypothetical protein